MMQTRVNNVTSNIFGAYVLKMRVIPGCEEMDEKKEKEREESAFEVIDDYIEEA